MNSNTPKTEAIYDAMIHASNRGDFAGAELLWSWYAHCSDVDAADAQLARALTRKTVTGRCTSLFATK
jgi:hypothetical protein